MWMTRPPGESAHLSPLLLDSILEDSDFEQACENADAVARRVYRDEAKAIEDIRKGILEVSGKEPPYDIFICYKETDESGERTVDSVLAQDVYDALTEKGYRVFFSPNHSGGQAGHRVRAVHLRCPEQRENHAGVRHRL